MTKKRSPIDVDALAALAAPQPDPVRTVLAAADGAESSTVVQLRPPTATVTNAGSASSRAPRKKRAPVDASETMPTGRAGKVGIQVWVDPEKRRRLRHYCTDAEITMDALVAEAIDEFIVKHGIK
jgi:hypothetical protein